MLYANIRLLDLYSLYEKYVFIGDILIYVNLGLHVQVYTRAYQHSEKQLFAHPKEPGSTAKGRNPSRKAGESKDKLKIRDLGSLNSGSATMEPA